LSVDLYISKATEGIQKKIKENLDFAKANPYPKEELQSALDSAGQDSALSKLYTLEGQSENFIFRTPEANLAAKEQADVYPGLWAKLSNGQKGLTKLARNKELESIKPVDELNSEFTKFITELNKAISLGAKIKVEDIFSEKTDNDTFDSYLDDFSISLNSYGADSLIRPAFTELFNKQPTTVPKPSEVKPSTVNAAESTSGESKEASESSINSAKPSPSPSKPAVTAPINPATTKSSEPTSITSLDGGVTSKVGELQAENILEPTSAQPININLENKPAESKPVESASTSKTVLDTSTSTAINNVNSTSSETSNPSNTTNNVGVTGDKNIMKVENANNQSSSSTVNENKQEKEKGGFLSKVGSFAKKAGAVLNLPSVAELKGQAKDLLGVAGENINSRISEVKNSFAINSSDSESNSVSATSTTNSVNSSNNASDTKTDTVLANPETGSASNTSNVLRTETPIAMNVEQNKPAVVAAAPQVTSSTQSASTSVSAPVSNTANSQITAAPQSSSSTVSQNTQSSTQAPSNPAAGGAGVDLSQLAQSIMRLERTIMSGIEVTIKDT